MSAPARRAQKPVRRSTGRPVPTSRAGTGSAGMHTTRPAAALDPTVCRCPTGPLIIATFRKGDLVAVERMHWSKDGCAMGAEHLDPVQYARRST